MITGAIMFAGLFALFAWLLHAWINDGKPIISDAKIIDAPERWTAPKSTYGGILFFIAFLLGAMGDWQATGTSFNVWIFLAAVFAFCLGLWDDLARIGPKQKFLGQFIAAALAIIGGLRLSILPEPFDAALTFIFIVAIMNSYNMLDNMDAVATIVAISVMVFVVIGYMLGLMVLPFSAVTILAALLAFLFFNWHPSKIFMGDSGTMLLGLFMPYLLLTTNFSNDSLHINSGWMGVGTIAITAITLLAVPITDTLVVIIQRLRHGKSPMQGGRDHTTHNLVYLGLSERNVAFVFILLTIIQTALSLRMNFALKELTHSYSTVQFVNANYFLCYPVVNIVYFILLFITMLTISFGNLRKGKYSYSK
jgi:UDP-GlcNAc:undecaprenyl-phosphate/decaprenyl-phosphate GlcNAc-1-phosphate transferase